MSRVSFPVSTFALKVYNTQNSAPLVFPLAIGFFSFLTLQIQTEHSSPPPLGMELSVVMGALYFSNPSWGCDYDLVLKQKDLMRGKVVYVDRGYCSFFNKIWNAQEAGAIGVLVREAR